jgi:RNA polymerase sigma factor (sigma-70 family)
MREGDFERLYDTHAQGLFAFLAYRTGDRTLAEDLVADTFERALRARRRFDRRRGGEKAWLYAIALNLLRDHARREGAGARARERAGEPVLADPEGGLPERVERRDELRAALAQLSPQEREAVALKFAADLTLREIAAATGESMTTVEGRVYRGLRKLRQAMDGEQAAG